MQIFILLLILLLQTSCAKNEILSRTSSGYRTIVAPWLTQSNASDVEKAGWWDGCSAANVRGFNPTNVRHVSSIDLDSEYLNDNIYKNAWKYGYYYCHITRSAYRSPYLRGWNAIGFKGAAVSFKGGN